MKTVEEKLVKFKIDKKTYNDWKSQLKIFEFEESAINRVILRRAPSNTVNKLISIYPELKDDFNHNQLISIAACNGGSKNLDAVKANYKALRELEFTPEQIVAMVSHNGGSKNLHAVKANYEALRGLEFTPEQIIAMVSNHAGSKNLDAVKANYEVLRGLKFTLEQIVAMVSHDGGSKNLDAVKANYEALRRLEVTSGKIVSMVAQNSGWLNIRAIVSAGKEAKEMRIPIPTKMTPNQRKAFVAEVGDMAVAVSALVNFGVRAQKRKAHDIEEDEARTDDSLRKRTPTMRE